MRASTFFGRVASSVARLKAHVGRANDFAAARTVRNTSTGILSVLLILSSNGHADKAVRAPFLQLHSRFCSVIALAHQQECYEIETYSRNVGPDGALPQRR